MTATLMMTRRNVLTTCNSAKKSLRYSKPQTQQPTSRLQMRHSSNATVPKAIRADTDMKSTLPSLTSTSSSAVSTNPFELGLKKSAFKALEATRPRFNPTLPLAVSQTPDTKWTYGTGTSQSSASHIEIDPSASDRSMVQNYKLLISGIPRPISFVSTVSKDGTKNLAPFSYFQVVDHDPPIFVIGFSGRASRPKDTRRNLMETGECVISVVSEHMIEAVNATSLDVPHGVSEWEVSGFNPAPSSTVKAERVADAIFSIEGRLLEMKELDYGGKHKEEGKPSGALAVIEGTRFWVKEGALNGDEIDLERLRPLVQLGGISYGRVRETFELPRPKLKEELEDQSNGLKGILQTQVGASSIQ